MTTGAVEDVSNDMIHKKWKYLTVQWKVALRRGDVGTSEDMGYKMATQLGCGFMFTIQVTPTGTSKGVGYKMITQLGCEFVSMIHVMTTDMYFLFFLSLFPSYSSCHGHYILLPLICYLLGHVIVGECTWCHMMHSFKFLACTWLWEDSTISR